MKKTPADFIINFFGGVRATARELNRSPSSISQWKNPRSRGGTGGEVPDAVKKIILLKAKKFNLPITLEDLFYGRS